MKAEHRSVCRGAPEERVRRLARNVVWLVVIPVLSVNCGDKNLVAFPLNYVICPDPIDRYVTSGRVVASPEECGTGECAFCCADEEVCDVPEGTTVITCEPCADVETFRDGVCAECTEPASPACAGAFELFCGGDEPS